MRIVWPVLIVFAGGCADSRTDQSKPRISVNVQGEVDQFIFSADGKAFLTSVLPSKEALSAERQKPRPWVLWSVSDGKEIARWIGAPITGFNDPGMSDGTAWPVDLFDPPTRTSRYRLLDLTTSTLSDIPGTAETKENCFRPSYSADRSRLAYSTNNKDPKRDAGRVYEKTPSRWNHIADVPGKNVILSPDGKLVATIAEITDNKDPRWSLAVRLITVADGKEQWTSKVDSYGLHGFTPDGRYIIQADNTGHRFFDVTTGQQALLVSTGGRRARNCPDEVAYRNGWVMAVLRTDEKVELVLGMWRLGKR